MHYYVLYGQIVQSELLLPEANELTYIPNEYDVIIQYALPPSDVFEKAKQGQRDDLSEQVMWFYLPGLVLYYVEHGKRILIWRESESISDLALRSYLLGSAFALLLMQRSIIPVHGSALSYQNHGIIISGPSGSGKSTTALSLRDYGYAFLSDDISALKLQDESVYILPGPPWQKVCHDVVTVAENPDEYYYIDEQRDKYARKLTSGYIDHPIVLQCIFIIIPDNNTTTKITKLEGIDKLHWLTHNIYRGEVFQRVGITPERLQLFLDITTKIDIYRITRPINIDSRTDIIQLINGISNNFVSFVDASGN